MLAKITNQLQRVFMDGTVNSAEETRSQLYECPSCATVFVAFDKEICLACHTEVERVE
jgi:hypothetical protein